MRGSLQVALLLGLVVLVPAGAVSVHAAEAVDPLAAEVGQIVADLVALPGWEVRRTYLVQAATSASPRAAPGSGACS